MTLTDHAIPAALKGGWPFGVIAAYIAGIDWQLWVWIATFAGVCLQFAYTAWKWHRDWRDKPRVVPTVPPPAE